MDNEWYRTFFQGIVLDFWAKAIPDEQTRLEADFLVEALRLKPGCGVLDLPCGLGRHSIELASRGYLLTAADQSEEAIARTCKRAAAEGATIQTVTVEMQDISWKQAFDAAFCLGNSFGYLTREGNSKFLKAVARALKPGARFAMDSGAVAESAFPNMRDREWSRFDDILFLEENHYHELEGRMETHYSFVRKGKSTTRTAWQCIYTLRELRETMEDAGLHPEHFYQSLNLDSYEYGSPYVLVVAERR